MRYSEIFEYYTKFSFNFYMFKYEYTNEKIIVCYFSFSDGKCLFQFFLLLYSSKNVMLQ